MSLTKWRVQRTILISSLFVLAATAGLLADEEYKAKLSGAEEVPAVETDAKGKAEFSVTPDGMGVRYELKVKGVTDLHMAHIHLAAAGANGPVVVWLYPVDPPAIMIPGEFHGTLAIGTFTAASLVGPLAGMTIADLVVYMQNGGAYVNIHSAEYPGGVIRGQIQFDPEDDDDSDDVDDSDDDSPSRSSARRSDASGLR